MLQNGLTPLHLCAQEDKVNVASILVKNGANVNSTTKVTKNNYFLSLLKIMYYVLHKILFITFNVPTININILF